MAGVDFAFLFSSTANTGDGSFSHFCALPMETGLEKQQRLALKPQSCRVQREKHSHGSYTSLERKK